MNSEGAKHMQYAAVIFDFDYTLGDATDAIAAGYTAGLTGLGWPAPEREAVRHTIGLPLELGYTELTGDADPAHQAEFRRLFVQVAHPMQAAGVPLFPGAVELLEALQAAGVRTAIVSTKRTDVLEDAMRPHPCGKRLEFIIGGDLVSASKPDPEGLNAAIARMGLEREQVLYVGDTVIDAETAQRAGTDFVPVLNGTTPAEAFDCWPHRHVAPDLTDLGRWLGLKL
jgi:phosphoglycolate phosphatase